MFNFQEKVLQPRNTEKIEEIQWRRLDWDRVSTERRRRTRKGFNWLAFHVFSRQGIEQKARKRLHRKRKRNRRKVSMADQARSIEYRLKRYCGSLRSPMRENRTTVGQLSVFSLHFCSILPLSLLFFFLFQRGIAISSLCTTIVGTTRARKLHGFPFLRRGNDCRRAL